MISLQWSKPLEKKQRLEIGRETHSNIKYLCGGSVLEIAKARFGHLFAIAGLQTVTGASHHLTRYAITRHASQMSLSYILGKWLWDWTEGFIENGVINWKIINTYIPLPYTKRESCIGKAPDSHHKGLSLSGKTS